MGARAKHGTYLWYRHVDQGGGGGIGLQLKKGALCVLPVQQHHVRNRSYANVCW
jgi:hypothetical protein